MRYALLLVAVLTSCKAADDYARKSKMTEAKLQLNKITKLAKASQIERGAFPVGKTGLTPAAPCCGQPNNKCQPDPTLWSTGPWKELDFQIDEPHLFRYSYESDGKTFTATAVGDLDCDTSEITYTARGKIVNDMPETTIDDQPSGKE